MAHPIAIVSQHKGCHAVEKGVLCIEGLDEEDTAHRYGPNTFKLRRLPAPRPGEVLGLVGTHSIGKTTALNVLAGLLKPNLGRFSDPPDWPDILTHLHDRELKTYFTQILENKPTIVFKPQHIYDLRGYNCKPNVGKMLESYDQRGKMKEVCDALELNRYLHLRLDRLSGGLLQRVTIAAIALQKADVYIFDEPSNFLDVTQRFKAAQVIRSLISPHSYVIVVDNDLSVIDYISDAVYCLYGKPEAYGVFTRAFNVRAGIEIYLDGFDPLENRRIRGESRIFEAARTAAYDGYKEDWRRRNYPDMTLTRGSFKLQVTGAELKDAQIFVMLGANGTGKTTFIRMLAGLHSADEVEGVKLWRPLYMESYKPQIINLSGCTVRELLEKTFRIADMHPQFISDVLIPLQIERLMDRNVASLSFGETQRVAIARCLAKPASVYLIDEPSEYLDSDERISAAMAIRRHILRKRKAAVIVEHDFMMATYLADQVILVEETQPSTTEFVTSSPSTTEFVISSPYPLIRGMNKFLSHQNITFRRDPFSFKFAPRVNKLGSIEDMEQKRAGNYYDLN